MGLGVGLGLGLGLGLAPAGLERSQQPKRPREPPRARRPQYGMEAMLKGAGRLVSPSQSCPVRVMPG